MDAPPHASVDRSQAHLFSVDTLQHWHSLINICSQQQTHWHWLVLHTPFCYVVILVNHCYWFIQSDLLLAFWVQSWHMGARPFAQHVQVSIWNSQVVTGLAGLNKFLKSSSEGLLDEYTKEQLLKMAVLWHWDLWWTILWKLLSKLIWLTGRCWKKCRKSFSSMSYCWCSWYKSIDVCDYDLNVWATKKCSFYSSNTMKWCRKQKGWKVACHDPEKDTKQSAGRDSGCEIKGAQGGQTTRTPLDHPGPITTPECLTATFQGVRVWVTYTHCHWWSLRLL